MSLLNEALETCTMIHKTSQDDPYGGESVTYIEGAHFQAAVTLDTSVEARVAMSQGVKNMYSVYTRKSKVLLPFEIFRRDSDQKTFRVTSDSTDKKTPGSAALDLRVCTAEEWAVPGEVVVPEEEEAQA